MKLIFVFLCFFTKNIFSQNVEIFSYKESTYKVGDTLKFSIKNISSKKNKISFSIDLFYEGKWREIDNDIYQKKPKTFHYFLISINCRKKFDFPLVLVDSAYLKEIKSPKFRIVLNIYNEHPFKLSRYHLNEFTIQN